MNSKGEKLDLRTRRTRKLLQSALLDLLKERDLEAISVTDICDRAMIHRTTFYKHYEDKFDLLNQGMAQTFRELSKGLPAPEEAVIPTSPNQPPQNLVRLFQHAADNPTFYALVRSGPVTFRKQFEAYLVAQTQARLRVLARKKRRSAAVPDDILACYSVGAVVKVLFWWLEQKDAPPPLEMARHLTHLLYEGVQAELKSG
jgi:AcrR family transcriptional regulator